MSSREHAAARAAGLLVGFAADRVFGDPAAHHPVAGFGQLAGRVESLAYRDHRAAGAWYAVVCVAVPAGLVALVSRRLRVPGSWAGEVALTAVTAWVALGGTSLARTGEQMATHLLTGDLAGARRLLPSLCGRDPERLDADGLARAALESIAENTSDASVAPVLWGAVLGPAGLVGYRAVNTLDAMVGYRSPRYRRFGWASARLDDLANLAPARVAGALTVLLAPRGAARASARAWGRDAAAHPSPNAGIVEAATAGALGVRLGGRTEYAHGTESRPVLGEGRDPRPADLVRAVRLSRKVQLATAALSALVAVAIGEFRVHRRTRLRARGGRLTA